MRILILLFLMPLSLAAQEAEWPDLNAFKYVSGRVAKEADLANKSAIFILKDGGDYIGVPIDMELPQYAIYTDGEVNKKIRVVIIQAESAQGVNMYGGIDIRDGSGVVSLDTDFKLLGKSISESESVVLDERSID